MAKLSNSIVVVGAKRTPFGTMLGALSGLSANDLAVHASKAALEQSGIEKKDLGHVIVGNVMQTSPDAIYCARHVGLKAGLPIETPALTVNRLCGSGFQAIVNGAEQLLLGETQAVLVAGTENMTQSPFILRGARQGWQFGKAPPVEDSLWTALTDSYCNTPMAVTAENLAVKYGISRQDCDAFALVSQQRWAAANEAGRFKSETAPIELTTKKGTTTFAVDEHPRPQTTLETLAKLAPVFKKDGVVTAGNASGICDGAAALVLATEDYAKQHGLKPLARIVQWGVAGARHPQRAFAGGAEAGRHRPVRGQRGVRSAVPGGREGARPRSRPDERRRRRHRPRSPAGGQRGAHRHPPGLRARAARGTLRRGQRLHRGRPGHRRGDRARLTRSLRRPGRGGPFHGGRGRLSHLPRS
jgi:acetyl-CoA C-acetyltransferase/acetyl-CoA acyltransferase 2